jgi:microcystin-dependent protein
MTVYANWLQNVDYPARIDRVLFDNLWEEGVIGASSFAVTALGTPAMSVNVAAGVCVVTGGDQAFQGKYLCRSESVTSGLAIAAAPGSGTRYDIVIVEVRDTNAGGPSGDDAIVRVVEGTASASPVDPTLPASSISLARITVASGTGSITNAMITNLRVEARVIGATSPSGSVMAFAGSTAPSGWLLCDGTAYSQNTYPALYAAIGSAYATSGGQSAPAAGLFRVPLLTGRVPVGLDSTQTEFDALGETGGDKASTAPHTHTIAHDHSIAHDHPAFDTAAGGGTHNHNTNFSLTADAVGNHGHTVSDTLDLEIHTHYLPAKQTSSTSHTHTGTSTVAAGISGGTDVTVNSGIAPYELAPDVDPGGAHGHSVSGTINVNAGEGSHQHSIDVPSFSGTSGAPSAANSGASSAATASGNLQPYIVLNYIVKT